MLVIFFTEERLLSAVSPVGDMVGHARSYHSANRAMGETNPATTPRQELGMVFPNSLDGVISPTARAACRGRC